MQVNIKYEVALPEEDCEFTLSPEDARKLVVKLVQTMRRSDIDINLGDLEGMEDDEPEPAPKPKPEPEPEPREETTSEQASEAQKAKETFEFGRATQSGVTRRD